MVLFALEVAAFIGAAFLLAALPRTRARFRTPAVAAAALVVGCAAALAAASTPITLYWLLDTRGEELARSDAEATRLGGVSEGLNEPFIDWVREQLEPGDTIHVAGADPRLNLGFQWLTFRLLPHLAAESAADADVLVFHDRWPSGYDRRRFDAVRTFAPGFHIVRRSAG